MLLIFYQRLSINTFLVPLITNWHSTLAAGPSHRTVRGQAGVPDPHSLVTCRGVTWPICMVACAFLRLRSGPAHVLVHELSALLSVSLVNLYTSHTLFRFGHCVCSGSVIYMAEYQKILKLGPQLRLSFQDHLDVLADDLLAAGLISSDNGAEVRNPHLTAGLRASRLLELIRNRVRLSGKNYDVFVKALKTNPELYSGILEICLLYTSPSPRDATLSRMPSSA